MRSGGSTIRVAAARLLIARTGQPLAWAQRQDPRFAVAYEDRVATVFTARLPGEGR